jgi:zinc protease
MHVRSRLKLIWRKYRFGALLLSTCLGVVLLLTPQAISMQSPTAAPAATPELSLTQDVQETVLDNGLTVLTKEVHTAPVVDLRVWYRIGSTDEEPGDSGIAHVLEHMLFKGTSDRPIQWGRLLQVLSGFFNAGTHYEFTTYINQAESGNLEALLTLEADRMQNALIDPQELQSEKQVVISEIQGYENNPGYRLNNAVLRQAFPDSPYGLPIGGTPADVSQFTAEQVQAYYRKYYSPENTFIVVVGDFETEPTLDIIRRTFGQVPPADEAIDVGRTTVTPPTPPDSQANNPPIVLQEPGSVGLLQTVYPLPDINHPDVPALGVMDYVLTGGRTSRLYQALVETGLASDVSGFANNLIDGGWYRLLATAPPNQDLQQIEQALDAEITRLQNEGITQAELDRAKRQVLADTILATRSIEGQAQLIGIYQLLTGDYRRIDQDLAAIANVDREAVQQVAQTYLTPANRTIGFFEPTQQANAAGAPAAPSQITESFLTGEPVDPAEVEQYLPPTTTNTSASEPTLPTELQLENGLTALLLPDESTPTITMTGFIRAGREFDTLEKAGLSDLTATNVLNGTETRTADDIALALEEQGASLSFSPGREGVIVEGYSLASDLPRLLEIFADVVQNATFPEDWLALTRQQALSQLAVTLDSPGSLANRVLQQTIYPETHPYHTFSTEESLNQITRADLQQFYQTHYQPEATTLVLKGAFDADEVRSLLETQLGSWDAPQEAPVAEYPPVELPASQRLNPVIPGKAQAITFMGHPQPLDRNDPRYYPLQVLNQILGGGGTLASRLGTEIRDRQGLTYGIFSVFQAGIHAGPFIIQMQTAPENVQQAVESTIAILEQVQQSGVTQEEVAIAKQAIANEYAISLADPDALASTILINNVVGLDPEELQEYNEKIQAVTPAQVNQVAAELLRPENLVIVTAGPDVALEQ